MSPSSTTHGWVEHCLTRTLPFLFIFIHAFSSKSFAEGFQGDFLQALRNEGEVRAILDNAADVARRTRTPLTLDLNGPLVRQLFYQTGVARRIEGFPTGFNRVAPLPHQFMLLGFDEEGHIRLGDQGLRLNGLEAEPNSAQQVPTPLLGVRFQISARGRVSMQMGLGFQRLSNAQRLTQTQLRQHITQLNRLSYDSDQHRDLYEDNTSALELDQARASYARDVLDGMSYLKALGMNVGPYERLITEIPQNSIARENLASYVGEYLFNTPHALAFARLLRQNRLHRQGEREIPAPLSDQRLPSEMGSSSQVLQRFEGLQVLIDLQLVDRETEPTRHARLRRLNAGNFQEGQMVQHNGLENPFLAYVGTKLKDIPIEVRRQAGISDDFTFYHRTNSAHAADALVRGHAFPSLGGDVSLLGGHATWGAGLYLGASPNLSRYGNEMVTTRIDPEAVVGQDLDLFVGERDGLVAIIKRDGLLSYQRHGPDNFLELAREKITQENPKHAIELLEQLPRLTFAQAQRLGRVNFSVRAYLSLRFPSNSDAFSDSVQEGFQRYADFPESITPENEEALREVHRIYPEEPRLSRLINNLDQHTQRFNLSFEDTIFVDSLKGSIERVIHLADMNSPSRFIEHGLSLITRRIPLYDERIQSHLGESPTIARRLAHLNHYLTQMVRLKNLFIEALEASSSTQQNPTIQRLETMRDGIWPRIDTFIEQMQQTILNEYERNPASVLNQLAEVALLHDIGVNPRRRALLFLRDNEASKNAGLLIGLLSSLSTKSEPTHPTTLLTGQGVNPDSINSSQEPMHRLLNDLYTLAAAQHHALQASGTRPNVPARLREPLARLLVARIPLGSWGRAGTEITRHFGDRLSVRVRAEVSRQLRARQAFERRMGIRETCGFAAIVLAFPPQI